MELNRDEIIKALECCISLPLCDDCPRLPTNCRILEDALALINQLAEENERLSAEVSVKKKLLDKAEVRIQCVEEENNQLKADICNATMNLEHITKENEKIGIENFDLICKLSHIKADTVRKMQEMVNECFDSESDEPKQTHDYIRYVIEKIAKELLEGVCDT